MFLSIINFRVKFHCHSGNEPRIQIRSTINIRFNKRLQGVDSAAGADFVTSNSRKKHLPSILCVRPKDHPTNGPNVSEGGRFIRRKKKVTWGYLCVCGFFYNKGNFKWYGGCQPDCAHLTLLFFAKCFRDGFLPIKN